MVRTAAVTVDTILDSRALTNEKTVLTELTNETTVLTVLTNEKTVLTNNHSSPVLHLGEAGAWPQDDLHCGSAKQSTLNV